MTWNMLVTQAVYSFAQAWGARTGKSPFWFNLINKTRVKSFCQLHPSESASGWQGGSVEGWGCWWGGVVGIWRLAGQMCHQLFLLLCMLPPACCRNWTQRCGDALSLQIHSFQDQSDLWLLACPFLLFQEHCHAGRTVTRSGCFLFPCQRHHLTSTRM